MLELGGDWEQGEWDSYWWSPGVRSWGLGVLSTKLERGESLVLFIQKKLAYIWWASIRNTSVGLCAKSLQSLWPHGLQHLALSVHEILQARILEWVAMPSSRGSFRPRDQTRVSYISCIADRFLTAEPPGKPILWIREFHEFIQISYYNIYIFKLWQCSDTEQGIGTRIRPYNTFHPIKISVVWKRRSFGYSV